MTADLILKTVLDLEPGESARVNKLDVRRWSAGSGWTVGAAPYLNVVGSSNLPTVIKLLLKGPRQ